jgi:hypothetical protein
MAKNKRTPYNPESQLFKSLTRLFSGPVTQRRTQTGRQLRRRHLDIYGQKFRSASGKQFKKSEYNPINQVAMQMISNRNRSERYIDFDEMEYVPEIASALDIYADEMTTYTEIRPMIRIKCANEEIKHILHNLYHNVLNIEHNLFGWSRTMCKYGDFFLYLDIDEELGIRSAIGLPAQEVERLEGEDETNPNYVQFQWNSAGLTLENWQVAHFRILGNDKHTPYGTSVLEASRRIYRQLILLEDAMMAYRIVRAPERRMFKIDVGGIPPQEVEQYMQKVMTQMKRHQVVDPTTGKVDLRYNPLSIEEDYYIPVRGQTATDIVSLKGGEYTGQIEDVKYLRDKLFAALKVPQSYLTMGEGATEDKASLAQKDIRFARTIQRLQRVVIAELEKIGIIHLYTLGYRDDDLLSFKLQLNNPSKIAELQEIEHWKARFEIAGAATDGYFSKRWIAEHLLGMSEDEFLRNQREMFFDKKYSAKLEAAAEGAPEAKPDVAAGLPDIEEPKAPTEEPKAPEAPAEGDEDLLAEPAAKRDDKEYKRGPYKRHQSSYDKGRRIKNYRSIASTEVGTARSTFPGKTGFGGLDSIARGMVETKENFDSLDEEKLFTTNAEVESLLEGLFNKDNNDETQ